MPVILPPRLLARVMPTRSWSRRQFLRASLLGTASLLISARIAPRKQQHHGRVLIIGAGLAGLCCAYELQHAGFDVMVFEARRRIGGRVLSTALKDSAGKKHPIELGGELIGLQHSVWGTYAQRFSLSLDPVDDHDASLRVVLDGKVLSDKESVALAEEVSIACNMMNEDAASIASEQPWLHPQAHALDHLPVSQWIEKLHVSPRAKAYLANYFGTLNGVDVSRQSYLAHLASVAGGGFASYWTDSEELRCREGSQGLAHRLAAAVGPSRIALGSPVTCIKHTLGHAELLTAQGKRFDGDAVVLAVPPSVWPQISMEPALPSVLTPQLGDAVKAIVLPQRPFWGETPMSVADNAVCASWLNASKAAMVCFSGGAAASKARASTPREMDARVDRSLREIFPAYEQTASTRRARMDWKAQPFTRGAYSVPDVGSVTTQGPLLYQAHQGLHIAGEHANYSFWGYMEGALRSGSAVADRIAST